MTLAPAPKLQIAATPDPVNDTAAAFWRTKSLETMTASEWEALCDGCAKCCLAKLQDADTDEIAHTNVACRLLDLDTCRCGDYDRRQRRVPGCQVLTPSTVAHFQWLPSTCAYRLVAAGRDLPWWHHLVSGDRDLVHRVGASVWGRAVPEAEAGPLEHHIVTWPA
ncbi:MAG: YcgN family cysteine cluster protein [Rhodospirillales bacterium]|nr:MAG: YcgN family cysteine cluster protein [Rhodospirillales bacterium]